MEAWELDSDFVAWLDKNGFGTDDRPLDDDTLNLMWAAWTAGRRLGRIETEEAAPRWQEM